MEIELIFKIILIVEYSIFSILRIRYQLLAQKAGYKTVIKESRIYPIFLGIFISYEVFTLFVYLLYPRAIQWASISMPLWPRFVGVLLGVLALLFFVWIHRNLGKNFSVRLRISDKQTIIATGPYKWIRHPMYTAFYVLHIAAFFVTANWFIGITWLAGLTIIIALRVKKEESMMISKFGDEYVAYMGRTGRFVPVIKVSNPGERKS